MRRSSREIPARVCQPENPFGQARQPDHLANPPPHLRPHDGVAEMLSPGSYGPGGAWGTQAWMDPVKGVAYVLMVQRSNFPNSDASDVRLNFPASRRKRARETVRVSAFRHQQSALNHKPIFNHGWARINTDSIRLRPPGFIDECTKLRGQVHRIASQTRQPWADGCYPVGVMPARHLPKVVTLAAPKRSKGGQPWAGGRCLIGTSFHRRAAHERSRDQSRAH